MKRSRGKGPGRRTLPTAAGEAPAAPGAAGAQVTYRELRNTPGRVWERLAANEPLTLVADGEPKAVVIPVNDGDVQGALEAYRRGRAMMALNRIQARARATGTSRMTLAEINRVIADVRRERTASERGE